MSCIWQPDAQRVTDAQSFLAPVAESSHVASIAISAKTRIQSHPSSGRYPNDPCA